MAQTFKHRSKHRNGTEFVVSAVNETHGYVHDGVFIIDVSKSASGKYNVSNIKVCIEGSMTPLFGGQDYWGFVTSRKLNYTPYVTALNKVFNARTEAKDITKKIAEYTKQLEELRQQAEKLGLTDDSLHDTREPQIKPSRPLEI